MNLGVIEIGSRAIRLVVAAAARDDGLRVVATGTRPTPACAYGEGWVRQLSREVADLSVAARENRAQSICVFGTESLRALPAKEARMLAEQVPGIRVLSASEEAQACHASACLVATMAGALADTVLSADIGHGSFESCAGPLASPGKLTWYLGTPLGASALRDIYVAGGLRRVRDEVTAQLSGHPYTTTGGRTLLFASGSAATRLAWLQCQLASDDGRRIPYKPSLAQGVEFERAALHDVATQLDGERAKNPARVDRLVGGDGFDSGEAAKMISGLAALIAAMDHTGQAKCRVNAYGGRHGLAWMLLSRERTGSTA